MTAEQRAEEANWFRKIGTKTPSLLVTPIRIALPAITQNLAALSFCLCESKTGNECVCVSVFLQLGT